MQRLLLLMLIFVLVCAGAAASAQEPPRREPAKPYRMIYNRDGSASYGAFDGDARRWIEHEFRRIENSSVDLIAWCFDGGNAAEYYSDILEHPGDADVRAGYELPDISLNGVLFPKAWKALRKMIREGNDPPQVIIRAAREHGIDVFVSYRLNDTHDSKGTSDNPTLPNPEFAAFKREHPEWLIGDMGVRNQYGEYQLRRGWSGVNFAVAEVRALKLAIIEELFHKYDFDGIELDFTTQTPYFRPWQGYRNQYMMTDFVRTVRRKLDQRANERGRRIVVAAHVFETPLENRLYGFDLRTWVREGLVDLLTIGRGNHLIDVPAFQEIVAGTPVRIYPCVYRPDDGYDVARGWASVYRQQNVDGVYTFNWGYSDPEGQGQTIRDMADPQRLRFRDKTFRVQPGQHTPVYWKLHAQLFNMLPTELVPTQSETPLIVPLRIGDDLAARPDALQSLRFEIGMQNATADDVVEVRVNGRVLDGGLWDDGLLVFAPNAADFRHGDNQVGLRLVQRAPNTAGTQPVVVQTIEVRVDYRDDLELGVSP